MTVERPVRPVSYTQLDVYKRQAAGIAETPPYPQSSKNRRCKSKILPIFSLSRTLGCSKTKAELSSGAPVSTIPEAYLFPPFPMLQTESHKHAASAKGTEKQKRARRPRTPYGNTIFYVFKGLWTKSPSGADASDFRRTPPAGHPREHSRPP